MAGEIAHLPIALDGPNCPCGTWGCPARYIGRQLLLHTAGLVRFAEAEGGEAALAELDRRLRAGDTGADAALETAGHALGAATLGVAVLGVAVLRVAVLRVAVLRVAGVTDAGEITLGGHLATWRERLRPGLDARLVGRRALAPTMQPLITFGVLGAEATLRGASQTCRDALLDDPTSVPIAPPAPVATPLP
ncbi:ROK family protein [Streptomyces graminifolii]|uniref:ROK family protein n=1 Tax=Streptomyces graminifolii TaxID=1266771 RepID=UPI004057D5B7